ncbi:MAG: transglycosylase SLT domain-containing protein [Chloroflexi bacterium]|nr:transglycosylase SLT domain-containing protein [Chloroflexota bacterium]MCY4248569.1 transglycosylase SLT domain-containing protein [Chloroflexota bacterium]
MMPRFSLLRALGCLLCLLACGCNISKPESPAPTVNASQIIVVTATPGLSAQTAPTPQPQHSAADDLFEAAEGLARNGYLEAAADAYLRLLNDTANLIPNQRAAAIFRYGQVALRAGYFQQAADAFSRFIADFPSAAEIAQAFFLRGDARLGLSLWRLAIDDLQQYLALMPGLIDSYAYERIADAQIALGEVAAALEHYALATNSLRSLVPLLALREKVAQIYTRLGYSALAVEQYDAVLAVARNQPYRAQIALSAAQALLQADDVPLAVSRLQAVVADYSNTATAWQAQVLLDQLGYGADPFERGKAAYAAGDWAAAADAFSRALAAGGAPPAELYLKLGQAQRNLGNSQAATSAFQSIIDLYPDDALFGAALLERGRTRFLANDHAAAIELYLAVADDFPQLTAAAGEALWRAGYLYGTGGETALSRRIFLRLADTYPQHELTTSGLFLAASAAVRESDWSGAAALYSRIASLTSGADQAAAQLWLGRIALRQGDAAAADRAFAQAITAAPDSYFAARASDIRSDRLPFQPPAALNFDFDPAAELAAAEQWLRSAFAVQEPGDLWPLSPELAQDPRWIRGRELFSVGAMDEALGEFAELLSSARDAGKALDSYRLAIAFRDMGAYRESIIAAADVIIASGQGTLGAAPAIGRLRFPAYYIDLISPAAQKYGFDPLLMLSLIRQESLFNTYATAGAGEKGMTQVIPGTAQYIAEQLQWPDYEHSALFRPYAAVEFGSYYLDEQLDLFDQNSIAALAAYNAGPGRAYDWRALAGDDPDLFMTTITIDSTRKYIQFIYRNHTIYRALYGGG